MADQGAAAKRAAGLTKLFHAVIHGHRELKSIADSNRFLEAITNQDDPSKCVECLIAAPVGLSAIAKAFRFSNDIAFLNGPATTVILYLSQPSIKQLHGGQFQHRVLEKLVQPPTFWNTLVEAHSARVLTPEGCRAFAWLLLELLCSRSEDVPDVRGTAARLSNNESLVNSDSLEVRNLGHKIKQVLDNTSDGSADGPGGRHDNDFADFRKVKILPTPDEFASTSDPFYRRADAIELVELHNRGPIHLDNQFRLLREDLLGELRGDFQIATGQKKGRRRIVLTDLQFKGIDCGPPTRRKRCSLKLQCKHDIPQLSKIEGVPLRKKYITNNKNLLKHQSLGCLVSGGNLIAFATVERDEDLLAQEPAVVVLRIVDAHSFRKVLMACKTQSDLSFVQVDTAVFAYEPILQCLQDMAEMPLEDQLLNLTPGSAEAVSGIQPTRIINAISDGWEGDLQDLIGTTQPIRLDVAQTQSLLTGLANKVSLIQGPPGECPCTLIFEVNCATIPLTFCMGSLRSRSSS